MSETSEPNHNRPDGQGVLLDLPPLRRPVPHPPDQLGHFGPYGGRYVPEVLMAALDQLTDAFDEAMADPGFHAELDELRRSYAGRPTPLTPARRLSEELGLTVWLKREDLLHTGAHKLNNSLGQQLLTRRMGKPRVIAETGAGQHGVATATAAALLGQECVVYMGEEDTRRQHLNVVRMRLLGTEVRPVATGTATLKDAINEALRDWVESVGHTHYAIGSVVGPHPFPLMVREFQRVIGEEARAQLLDAAGRLPDLAVACVGGGSNAAGLFAPFIDDATVQLVGVEAGGRGRGPGDNGAPLNFGQAGVLHGARSYLLQDPDGQVLPTHSVSAGLDYPGVGPEHALWKDDGRVTYTEAGDRRALDGFQLLARTEGILPALEPAHAIGWLASAARAGGVAPGSVVVLNLSGRGDKDVETVASLLGMSSEGTEGEDAEGGERHRG
ncbi:MAG TPA: tryptophan synthase subunit beta [Actinomycetota bacterium]|nr:tryptophan synthase subunit beta [Actinomycetota bacterium]